MRHFIAKLVAAALGMSTVHCALIAGLEQPERESPSGPGGAAGTGGAGSSFGAGAGVFAGATESAGPGPNVSTSSSGTGTAPASSATGPSACSSGNCVRCEVTRTPKSFLTVADPPGSATWSGLSYEALQFEQGGGALVDFNSAEAKTTTLFTSGYEFDLPSDALLRGISVKWSRAINEGCLADDEISVYNNHQTPLGTKQGFDEFSFPGFTIANYGSSADMWDAPITPATVSTAGFGFGFRIKRGACGSSQAQGIIEYIGATIYYDAPECPIE